MQGWISLHRKLLESKIFQNEKLLKVFIYCLLKASHIEHQQQVGRQVVTIKPGQFVFGRKKAAMELNMKESTVRDYMNLLKYDNTIDIKSTNKYSIVTIVNWELYQDTNEKRDNKNDSKDDNKKTAEGQQINTNNNDNNGNNVNKEYMRKIELFNQWWNLYNKKVDRKKCETKFLKILEKHSFEEIVEGTKRYLDYLKATNTDKQYQKHPLTFLNGENWKDEYEEHQKQKQSQNRPIFKREPDYD